MGQQGQYVYMYRNERLNVELTDAWRPQRETPCGENPELFWSTRAKKMREAAELCETCEEKDECLRAARDQGEETYVWGGELPEERMKIVKAREGLKA